tara:strand:- start:460 stop:771 length:312 start_codon:yes stop_codon:yes gene_type:complete
MTTEMKLKLIQVVTYLFIYTSKQAINSSNKICDVIRCNKYIYVEYVSNNIKYIYMVQIYIYMTQVYIYIFVSKLFPKYIFSISNILENIIIFYLKHNNVKIMI